MHRTCRLVALGLVVAALLSGCGGCAKRDVRLDASAGAATAHAPTAITEPRAWDDLLHTTNARLAVSSRVENPRDFPEHIADGRLETAWNGKTGDLVGGWLGFRVPAVTRVRAIDLTVGFDARTPKGEDLFTANHRIARVRVRRDDEVLLEHDFDPDKRGLQRISLDAAGGDYKLEILEVKAGTRKEWRELVVSELRVLGIAGSAKLGASVMPRVAVGSFDAPPPLPGRAAPDATALESAPTVEALCEAFIRRVQPDVQEVRRNIERGMQFGAPPEEGCDAEAIALGTDGGPSDVSLLLLRLADARSKYTKVGVRYGGRVHVLAPVVEESLLWDPCPHEVERSRILDARVESRGAPAVVFRTYRWSKVYDELMPRDDDGGRALGPSMRTLVETRCELLARGPSCASTTIAERHGFESLDVLDDVPSLPW